MDFKLNNENEMEETVLTTPQPRACSTENKKHFVVNNQKRELHRLPLEFIDESLGVMSLNHDFRKDKRMSYSGLTQNMTELTKPYRKMNETSGSEMLELIRARSIETLLKANSKLENDKSQSSAESTVDESDLLQSYTVPRAISSSTSILEGISLLQNSLRNPNKSVQQGVTELMSINSNNSNEFGSHLFESAEMAKDKLMADELSWRRKHNLPIAKNSISFENVSVDSDKMSMGEFFHKKSEECLSIFETGSPDKREPVPLLSSTELENTTICDAEKNNSISSLIKQMLSSDTIDSPNKFLNIIMQEKKKENIVKKNKPNTSYKLSLDYQKKPSPFKKYSSSVDLTSKLGFSELKLSSAKSTSNIANKENICDKSISSLRSATSLDTLPEGKIVMCTKADLVWGSLKVGKVSSLQFEAKTKLMGKFKYQISTSNPSYKISTIDAEPLTSIVVSLQNNQGKSFRINFNPIKAGPQVGKLVFTPLLHGIPQLPHRQTIMMYGYGGHASFDITNVSKDGNGKLWLCFGILKGNKTEEKVFSVRNTGTIPGFVCMAATLAKLSPIGNIEVVPSKVVLQANESCLINVKFVPSRIEFKNKSNLANRNNMIIIGNISLIMGPESTRCRLLQLRKFAIKKKLPIESLLDELSDSFYGEYFSDALLNFKESFDSISILKHDLNSLDICITTEHDPDQTLMPDTLEETSIYHTITNNQSTLTELEVNNPNLFKVEPSEIILIPPTKIADNIILRSLSKTNINYSIRIDPDILNISSYSGVLKAGEVKILIVSVTQNYNIFDKLAKILITCDNEAYNVNVKLFLA